MRPSPDAAISGRDRITRAIEECGVVAVIRLKESEKLRAVVDALADGGVRALEITMTVPRAIDLIAAIAATLPDGFDVNQSRQLW